MKKFVAGLCVATTALSAQATISVGSSAFAYSQNFDSLATSGTSNPWANDSTLTGWSLFNATGVAPSVYSGDNGSSNGGAFKSFGTTGSGDRALGGVGSGGAYFGSPAAGSVAGYLAVAFTNASGAALAGFTLGFDGEQWRNGGNTSAQPMVLEYGFGASYASVTWTAPGGTFDWSSPVTGSTAAAVDGNLDGRVAARGGTLVAPWAAGDTLWVRWTERNDFGNDHGLAIDNLTLTVTPVPEPETYALMLAGLALVAGAIRRRRA